MTQAATLTCRHSDPPTVTADSPWALPTTPHPVGSESFVDAAQRARDQVPANVRGSVINFTADAGTTGAMLIRGVPVGVLCETPTRPTTPTNKDAASEFALVTIARLLGEPVGYLPEHGGDLVQNIVPVAQSADRQVSTSSKVDLMFHTEAAFHPHRPHYLLLLCLRGDRDHLARTTLASVREVAPLLNPATRDTLFEPRFRTAVDESYLDGRPTTWGTAGSVFYGAPEQPHMVFDADLMRGIDPAADRALAELSEAVAAHHTGVVLNAGDLLIVDNTVAVHGRSQFRPRFDGLDRWLQRTFVVADLTASAAERHGRIITTRFG